MANLGAWFAFTVFGVTALALFNKTGHLIATYIITIVLLFGTILAALGQPKPIEWERANLDNATVLAVAPTFGKSIDVLLDTPNGHRYYVLPWSEKVAKAGADANGAANGNGQPYGFQQGADGDWVPSTPPPSPLVPKE